MGGFEDADLALAFEVEKAHERGGLGDAEVVAREEAEPAASSQQVAEIGLDAVEAARHDEADGDVGSSRPPFPQTCLRVPRSRTLFGGLSWIAYY